MDPNEIVKAAPEVLKHGAELVGALKLTDIAKTILGPATGEFAERIKDEIRLYRFGRQLELLRKAEKMVRHGGFSPKAVPIKLLFPLLEGASLEDNDELHTMWAALLANAASPENGENVRPGFLAVLRQMAPDEAAIVNWIYDHTDAWTRFHGIAPSKLSEARDELGFRDKERAERTLRLAQRFASCLDGLEAEQLIRRAYMEKDGRPEPQSDVSFVPFKYLVTRRGEEFMAACRPPQPKF